MKIRRVETNIAGVTEWFLYVNDELDSIFENVADCNERIEHLSIVECRKSENVQLKYVKRAWVDGKIKESE